MDVQGFLALHHLGLHHREAGAPEPRVEVRDRRHPRGFPRGDRREEPPGKPSPPGLGSDRPDDHEATRLEDTRHFPEDLGPVGHVVQDE
jgi:hypothetical protein